MIKKFKKIITPIVAMGIILIALVVMCIIKVNYDIIVPAVIDNLEEVYYFEDYNSKDDDINIYSVSVLSYERVSLLQYVIAKCNKYAMIDETFTGSITTNAYQNASGRIQKDVSLTNALIAGYTLSGVTDTLSYSYQGEIVESVYSFVQNDIKLGDIVLSINGTPLNETNTFSSIWINNYRTNRNIDEKFTLQIKRNGEVFDYVASLYVYQYGANNYVTIGFATYQYYVIDNESSTLKYTITEPDNIGPSAGLMQSLYVYESLSGEKLTSGLKIVGTGTVDINGNAGSIGGVEAKIVAAICNNVDIFFCPEQNYDDALSSYNKYKTKMKLVKVTCLQDVVDYLRGEKYGTN